MACSRKDIFAEDKIVITLILKSVADINKTVADINKKDKFVLVIHNLKDIGLNSSFN